ncbi:ArsR family transcriptional regulator [Streptomyces sp. ActVer]|uniref:ArsR family transcriptional regulator n=1 Tax=Streptomyces sp. ActVer TaxID=3014558 RepID=UPI0022B550C6|nr:ArsR family transcriptional regulator [Streptomyces sp. ActVer]MCZ4509099.1 ArsR family transcriptional regulator [Streptomyces sp. ActVer]
MGFQLDFGRMAAGGGNWMEQAAVKELMARRDMQLLAAIRRETRNYVPGFMFAHSGPRGSLESELHQVASTPSGVVARQVGRFLRRARTDQRSASVDFRRILSFLESGEESFAERVAWEMGHFWSAFMSARWNAICYQMEGDIRHRAASMARRGLSATLNSLHPAFSYDSGALHIQHDRTWSLFECRRIVLHPSALVTTWMLRHDPWGESGTHLAYPVGTGAKVDHGVEQSMVDPLGQVIGEARKLLLADLGSSRTTTELAERHHMSASTVSYHLLRLHRVGLLNRTREGSRVYYQRTPEADRLVARRDCRMAAKLGRSSGTRGAVPAPRVSSGAVSLSQRFVGASSAELKGGRGGA